MNADDADLLKSAFICGLIPLTPQNAESDVPHRVVQAQPRDGIAPRSQAKSGVACLRRTDR